MSLERVAREKVVEEIITTVMAVVGNKSVEVLTNLLNWSLYISYQSSVGKELSQEPLTHTSTRMEDAQPVTSLATMVTRFKEK